jgi:hypothetical protein
MDIASLIWLSRSGLQRIKIHQEPTLDFPEPAKIEVLGEGAMAHDPQEERACPRRVTRGARSRIRA